MDGGKSNTSKAEEEYNTEGPQNELRGCRRRRRRRLFFADRWRRENRPRRDWPVVRGTDAAFFEPHFRLHVFLVGNIFDLTAASRPDTRSENVQAYVGPLLGPSLVCHAAFPESFPASVSHTSKVMG